MRDGDGLVQKLRRQRERMRILSDEPHLDVQHGGHRAQRHVDEQLVPDELLDVFVDLCPEAAPVERFLELWKDSFRIRAEHAEIGAARAAVTDMCRAEHGSLVLRRADDDVIF